MSSLCPPSTKKKEHKWWHILQGCRESKQDKGYKVLSPLKTLHKWLTSKTRGTHEQRYRRSLLAVAPESICIHVLKAPHFSLQFTHLEISDGILLGLTVNSSAQGNCSGNHCASTNCATCRTVLEFQLFCLLDWKVIGFQQGKFIYCSNVRCSWKRTRWSREAV